MVSKVTPKPKFLVSAKIKSIMN